MRFWTLKLEVLTVIVPKVWRSNTLAVREKYLSSKSTSVCPLVVTMRLFPTVMLPPNWTLAESTFDNRKNTYDRHIIGYQNVAQGDIIASDIQSRKRAYNNHK